MEPRTDREELFFQKIEHLEERFSGGIDRLNDSIEKLITRIEGIERDKITEHDSRLRKIEEWKLKIEGGWKVLAAIAVAVGAGIGYLISYITK